MTPFSTATDVRAWVAPAVLAVNDVTIVARDPRMDEPIAATERAMRGASEAVQATAAVRSMYHRFGVDPTRTRPSSEALLRRLRKGETLPRINSLVDVGNWCSVETQLPYGLYDLDRVRGPIELRLGRAGEEYPGIRKDVVHVEGRLTLADVEGPFGNPTADSARTMVTTATRRALIVIYAPADRRREGLQALALTESRILAFNGGRVEWRWPAGAGP